MNRWIGLVATAASAFALSACATHAPSSGLVISNVTVVSPERAQPLKHAYVRIIDGRIAELSTQRLRGASQIDGTNRYLIPGLIDSHVHLAVPPGFPSAMTAQQAAAHPGIVAAALEQDPRSYLFFGFTTVVDLVGSAERTDFEDRTPDGSVAREGQLVVKASGSRNTEEDVALKTLRGSRVRFDRDHVVSESGDEPAGRRAIR